jgi:hypothetical protein
VNHDRTICELEIESRRRTGVHWLHYHGIDRAGVALNVTANEALEPRCGPEKADTMRGGDSRIDHRTVLRGCGKLQIAVQDDAP